MLGIIALLLVLLALGSVATYGAGLFGGGLGVVVLVVILLLLFNRI